GGRRAALARVAVVLPHEDDRRDDEGDDREPDADDHAGVAALGLRLLPGPGAAAGHIAGLRAAAGIRARLRHRASGDAAPDARAPAAARFRGAIDLLRLLPRDRRVAFFRLDDLPFASDFGQVVVGDELRELRVARRGRDDDRIGALRAAGFLAAE